jgi:Glycosyl hydrolases family 39
MMCMSGVARYSLLLGAFLSCAPAVRAAAPDLPIQISIDWLKVVATSRTNIAVQDCPEPPMYRGQPLHDKIYRALHDMNADYSRLQPWFPYPKLAVAELRPPERSRTWWDFKLLDEIVADFMQATAGHAVVFQPGTIPAWMTNSAAVRYPENPEEIDWTYGSDGKFLNSTVQQFADYQARLANWYIKGGFTDENGVRHSSGHTYRFEYWEPLNEEDLRFTPEQLTRLYDAAVESVRRVAPGMKFVGPTLADTATHPEYLTYFLNPANHKPGIPIDMLSYHFYTSSSSDETPPIMQRTIYRDADKFLDVVEYIEAIRKKVLPNVRTDITELGSIVAPPKEVPLSKPFPSSYWGLSGAVWAYMYGNLAAKGIDVVTAAELIDYPGQYASTTLVNWETGQPNARYWVVKLLHDNFGPGDHIIQQTPAAEEVQPNPAIQIYAQGFITPHDQRRVLLVNKRDRTIKVVVAGATGGEIQLVDQSTTAAPGVQKILRDTLQLPPSAVAVVTLHQ